MDSDDPDFGVDDPDFDYEAYEETGREQTRNLIRTRLNGYLAKARAAATLPWRNLTEDYLIEMQVYGESVNLPDDEARALREAFGLEMDRLYAASDQERPEVYGRDGNFDFWGGVKKSPPAADPA